MATPLRVFHLDVVDSTQDEARSRFRVAPVLVTAAVQRAGRGRSGSAWQTAPRAVAASLAWRPEWPEGALARLTLVAGLAAAEILGDDIGLKWPNDLMRGRAKLGGILTEHRDGVVVCGLGVNLFWPEAADGIGALGGRDPGRGAARRVATSWARRLLDRVAAGPDAWGRDEYRSRSVTLGRTITWEPSGSGTARDITTAGGLLVATSIGEVVIDSGAVRTVRDHGYPGLP